MDKFRTEFDHLVADAPGEDAAADVMLRLEDENPQAGPGERAGCGEAGHACTDDEDVMGVGCHALF